MERGVSLEVARIAPPGKAGAATGASLAMIYAGVVALPTLFWADRNIGKQLCRCVRPPRAALRFGAAPTFFRFDGQAPPDSP